MPDSTNTTSSAIKSLEAEIIGFKAACTVIVDVVISAIAVYCSKWRLQPSVAKTVSCVFHLHNANAKRKIDVRLNGQSLKCETKPVYLGVTLDRSLPYHDHLMKTAAKVWTRNNIISRLAGLTWGAQTPTLRTAALALCFSVAGYCAPVWCRSAHVNLVDVQLNKTLRTITGTLRSTPLPWLPVLSNIVPASFRRQEAVSRVIGHIQANTNLPSFEDIFNPPTVRLLSRYPVWLALPGPEFSSLSSWKEDWSDQIIWNGFLVADPSVRPPGFDLVRSDWVSLNRYRTGHGRCAASLHQWGIQDNIILSAPVAASRRCPTLSTSVRWRNATVASGLSTALKAKQLSGFAREAHAKKRRRRSVKDTLNAFLGNKKPPNRSLNARGSQDSKPVVRNSIVPIGPEILDPPVTSITMLKTVHTEINEKERRRHNVIVSGMKRDGSSQITDDIANCVRICSRYLIGYRRRRVYRSRPLSSSWQSHAWQDPAITDRLQNDQRSW